MEAQKRSTTVYLVQRAIPMLPRLLCEELCSLNPDVDRFAFSITWKMTPNGQILGLPWIGKSVIRTCVKMSYDHAQWFIDGHQDWSDSNLPSLHISQGTSMNEIRQDVLRLYEMSTDMRRNRFDNGALSINSIKLWFSLDESGNPMDCGPYEQKEANRMIEEVKKGSSSLPLMIC